jgi:long-subunit acyl-CoA synthetase (AMP-forming)
MTTGYFNLPEITKQLFIDGYFLTGDIGMIDGDGKLHLIDRKKNMIELYLEGQSFWVPVANLESKFMECGSIRQMIIHGQRLSTYLIAIVVPLKQNENIEKKILKEFSEIKEKYKLKDYETPQKILVVKKDWTMENGKMTQSGKLKRGPIVQELINEIELIYTQ